MKNASKFVGFFFNVGIVHVNGVVFGRVTHTQRRFDIVREEILSTVSSDFLSDYHQFDHSSFTLCITSF